MNDASENHEESRGAKDGKVIAFTWMTRTKVATSTLPNVLLDLFLCDGCRKPLLKMVLLTRASRRGPQVMNRLRNVK